MVARVLNDLEQVPDEALIGQGLEPMLAGAPFVLVDHASGAIVAMPSDWDTQVKAQGLLMPISAITGPATVKAALRFALKSLDAYLQMMMGPAVLPRRLAEFHYEAFAYFFRAALTLSRELWHWIRAIGLRIPGFDTRLIPERDVPLHPAEDAALASDWLGLQCCLL